MELFDALKRAADIETVVMRGNKRLYDRDKFRYQKFYGGIATAGSRGCQLKCLFCWNYERNDNPNGEGVFYYPSEVVSKLEKIAKGKTNMARISGAENFLGRRSAQHLFDIIANSDLNFVIETNAIILGAMPDILDKFKELNNFKFRVSLKATNGLMWEKLTGSNSWGFYYQQKAIEEILARHIPLRIAYMPQFVDYKDLDYSPFCLEEERMRYYPRVKQRLQEGGVKPKFR